MAKSQKTKRFAKTIEKATDTQLSAMLIEKLKETGTLGALLLIKNGAGSIIVSQTIFNKHLKTPRFKVELKVASEKGK